MTEFNWIQIGAAVVSGGLAGAVAKHFFDRWTNRVQPIGLLLTVKSFYDANQNKILNSKITFTGMTQEYKFNRLFTGSITLINKGNVNYPEFSFGLTGSKDIKFIYTKPTTTDRHHEVEILNEPTLENQTNNFDLNLKPFNRKDMYAVDFLLTSDSNKEIIDLIKVSSKHPIKWSNPIQSDKLIIEFIKTIQPVIRF